MNALQEIGRGGRGDNLSPAAIRRRRFGELIRLDFTGYAFCGSEATRCPLAP